VGHAERVTLARTIYPKKGKPNGTTQAEPSKEAYSSKRAEVLKKVLFGTPIMKCRI
jgi:hypothetical protein